MEIRFYFDLVRLHLYSRIGVKALRPNRTHPFRASIAPTENCNSRCITCNYWKGRWEDKVSKERWVEVIWQLRAVGVSRLRFTGGEPLLRRDFFEILTEIRHLQLDKVTLATNGLLLGKFAAEIQDSCLTDLAVSIDGLDQTNDRIRGVRGYFELVTSGLQSIRGKRITVMTTLVSANVDDLAGLIEMCEDNGWKWDFNLLDNRPYFLRGADMESLWPDRKQVEQSFDIIEQHRNASAMSRINNTQLRYAKAHYLGEILREPMCFLGYIDLDIDSSGNVYSGCYPLPPLGTILEKDVPQILSSPEYARRLEVMLRRQCPGCVCGYEANVGIEALPTYALEMVLRGRFK